MNYQDEVRKSVPTEARLDREITIDIVGDIRCIYINDHRVVGGKPYVSENLKYKTKHLNVRDVLEAFNFEDLEAYMR